ncbi:MAG: winged helix-turn-helix domain-containing protein [Victivallaceae bacterium]
MGNAVSSQRSRRDVLRLIKEQQHISRAELAKLTGLTRPTVSAIVNEFVKQKVVSETGKASLAAANGQSCLN